MIHETWTTLSPLRLTGAGLHLADAYCGGPQVHLLPHHEWWAVFFCQRERMYAEMQLIALDADASGCTLPLRQVLAGCAPPALARATPRMDGSWVEVGGIGVDAGAVAAYDARLDEDVTWGSDLSCHYEDQWQGCTGSIAWMPSGWGDGWYPVEVDDVADPCAIRVVCVPADDDAD